MLVDTQTAAPHRAAHIVWDWNGTLLHDTDVVVESVNACLAVFEAGPITVERYRDEYCVPIPRFYQRLLGRELSGPEWERLDGAFQRHYAQHAGRAALTEGATDLLLSWQRAGHTQSLCSLALHDQLTPLVTRLGIAGHFTRVDGSTGEGNRTGKAEQMARHLAALGSVPPERTVVIGDATDDALAAAHIGAHAVLYTGGSHSRRSLQRAGVPVVDSLADAVALAAELAA
ncbi:haloacid dehalogenase-like hydrolase [Streptomyces sp. XM4011]|jgi:phosphoglycolate phosphatase-like HAD superfamily hydrolase|uniref:Phosphoglycolate phosphatase, HAD superfamily n=1 Tax=Streptomyces harbinensis TaxID=1176198 RepID=A0A1I6UWY0_9ACTN|nr:MULTISPECIES: HAD family hydrolase [Streptomyces]MCK1815766.1 haloacid dehalogenase-like hydrolase [Streptomyces sp. XM4011]SFT05913.1 Phosphoglycolate phosphatase, HAD superfamily [Streptomyces harbinensis]